MKWLLCLVLIAAGTSPTLGQEKPLRIGVLTDLSSVYSDVTGKGVVTAVELAIADYGGRVAGRPIELVVADHQNKLDVGKLQAARWYDVDSVSVILDVANTPLAIAVKDLAAQRNRLFITTAATMAFTGEQCSPTTFQWTHDTWSVAYPVSRTLVERGLASWFYVTVDYALGRDLQAMSEEVVRAAGGRILGGARHPLGTADLSSVLLTAQASGAKVIATANTGDDTTTVLKQAAEFGIGGSAGQQQIAGLLASINTVQGTGLQVAYGIHTFDWAADWAARAKPAAMAANCAHPARMVLGPGGL